MLILKKIPKNEMRAACSIAAIALHEIIANDDRELLTNSNCDCLATAAKLLEDAAKS